MDQHLLGDVKSCNLIPKAARPLQPEPHYRFEGFRGLGFRGLGFEGSGV